MEGGRNREPWAISLKLGKKYQSLLLLAYYSLLRIRFRIPLAEKQVHSRSLTSERALGISWSETTLKNAAASYIS